MYGHTPITGRQPGMRRRRTCMPDANGYNTRAAAAPTAINYYEWCQDHNKPLESASVRRCRQPAARSRLPDPNIFDQRRLVRRQSLSGPGCDGRAPSGPTPIPPFGNDRERSSDEAGFAFMWHSHNEREITTNNIFPGGMMMMMLVDPAVFPINEAK